MATRKGGDASLVRIPYDTQIELYLLGATLISRPALLAVVDKLRVSTEKVIESLMQAGFRFVEAREERGFSVVVGQA